MNETKFKTGDPVAYFRHEAEIVIPDLGSAYWTRGARIKYTTGDKAGQLEDVPIAYLRLLAEHETAPGKARAAAERLAAEREAKREEVREELVAKVAETVEWSAKAHTIDLHTMTKRERESLENILMLVNRIYRPAIISEAIDRVREKTKKETT